MSEGGEVDDDVEQVSDGEVASRDANVGDGVATPSTLIEDEKKASGANPWTLYTGYLMGGGERVASWGIAVVAFAVYTSLVIGRVSHLSRFLSARATKVCDFTHAGANFCSRSG